MSDGDYLSDDDMLDPFPSERSSRPRRKEKYHHDRFILEGEVVSGFNSVMLAGIRTVRQLFVEGEDVVPALKHLEFMAKKSTMGVYKQDTYVEYDKTVRRRAGREGLKSLGQLETEEIATNFCPENMVSKDSKGASKASSKRKTIRYCRLFNDGCCTFKNCSYAHVCMACDELGHSRIECTKVKSKPAGNK